jgi:glucose/mannose transport system substrate-binding protein
MKKLATTASSWDDPKVSEALSDYSVILDNENADRSALSWDQAVKKMANGECLFNMMADSAYGELLKAGKVDGTDFGYFAYPGTDSVFLNVSDSFVVASTVADPTNALNWAKTIMDPKVQVDFSKQKGSIPVRTDVDVSSLGAYQQWDAACL